jgi:hypothetical protein
VVLHQERHDLAARPSPREVDPQPARLAPEGEGLAVHAHPVDHGPVEVQADLRQALGEDAHVHARPRVVGEVRRERDGHVVVQDVHQLPGVGVGECGRRRDEDERDGRSGPQALGERSALRTTLGPAGLVHGHPAIVDVGW